MDTALLSGAVIMWSARIISIAESASFMLRVALISLSEGVAAPEVWICAAKM